jgi:hypothetical protein
MDVPAGKLGSEFNSLLNKYSSTKTDPNAPVPVTIGLTGKYDSPSPKLVMDEAQQEQVKEAAVTAAKEEGTKALQKAVKGTEAEKTLNKILGGKEEKKDSTASTPKADTTKAVTTPPTTEEVQKKVEDEAKKKIQNLLKKKKN